MHPSSPPPHAAPHAGSCNTPMRVCSPNPFTRPRIYSFIFRCILATHIRPLPLPHWPHVYGWPRLVHPLASPSHPSSSTCVEVTAVAVCLPIWLQVSYYPFIFVLCEGRELGLGRGGTCFPLFSHTLSCSAWVFLGYSIKKEERKERLSLDFLENLWGIVYGRRLKCKVLWKVFFFFWLL